LSGNVRNRSFGSVVHVSGKDKRLEGHVQEADPGIEITKYIPYKNLRFLGSSCFVEKKMNSVHSDSAPDAVGPYSQAIRTDDTLYVSGQIGIDPQSGDMVTGGFEDETRQVLENLSAVVEAAGGSMGDVVKTTVYLTDLDHYDAFNDVYKTFFDRHQPARACVEVCNLPGGALVEVDLIATLDG
jgi:2-iminobutanoate/2-iminopropanoate deaminase